MIQLIHLFTTHFKDFINFLHDLLSYIANKMILKRTSEVMKDFFLDKNDYFAIKSTRDCMGIKSLKRLNLD